MKRFISIFLLCLFCSATFAEKWNVYAGADNETLETIKKCDEHIAKKEYQFAANTVGACNNEYIIYKYIEVCTQYFAMSMMHSMFAFKNLAEGETLHDVRTMKEGNYSMTVRDEPDKVIDNYKKEHGNSIVLELARANYYYDALNRYGNQWLKTPEEILSLAKDVYGRAIAKEVYDKQIVENYAFILMQENNWSEAEKLYTILSEKFSASGNSWYHLAICKLQQKKYSDAIYPAKMAVENPEENPEYHLDAYTVLADAYSFLKDYESAEKNLLSAHEKYPQFPLPLLRLGELYIRYPENKDYKKADSYFDKALNISCDPETVKACLFGYVYVANDPQMAIRFCNRNIKKHKEEINQGIFNYFLVLIYLQINDLNNAKKSLDKSEKIFKKLKNEEWLNYCTGLRNELNKQDI